MAGYQRSKEYTGSHGWQLRILQGTSVAASVGATSGALTAVVRGKPLGRYTAAAGGTAALAGLGLFAGAQEVVRELRHAHPDDLINSLLGGFGCGALLGGLRGGPARAWPLGFLMGVIGVAAHWTFIEIRELRLQRLVAQLRADSSTVHEGTLRSHDSHPGAVLRHAESMEPSTMHAPIRMSDGVEESMGKDSHSSKDATNVGRQEEAHEVDERVSDEPREDEGRGRGLKGGRWDLPEWFPIRRFDSVEAAKRAKEREKQFVQRVKQIHDEGTNVK